MTESLYKEIANQGSRELEESFAAEAEKRGLSEYDAMREIRNGAPMACGLSDCHHLPTAINRLLEFAHRAVRGNA